jgi:hypothetical protein
MYLFQDVRLVAESLQKALSKFQGLNKELEDDMNDGTR